jgi:hypothetical protein
MNRPGFDGGGAQGFGTRSSVGGGLPELSCGAQPWALTVVGQAPVSGDDCFGDKAGVPAETLYAPAPGEEEQPRADSPADDCFSTTATACWSRRGLGTSDGGRPIRRRREYRGQLKAGSHGGPPAVRASLGLWRRRRWCGAIGSPI